MTQRQTPAIQYEPPYSLDFVSHLDAGCYPAELTYQLMATLRLDPAGARMLDDLAIVRMELRLLAAISRESAPLDCEPRNS